MEINNLSFSICSLLNATILLVIYFSKDRIKTYETYKFKKLLILSFLLPIIELVTYILKMYYDANSFYYIAINKLIIIVYCMWVLTYLSYIISLTYIGENCEKKYKINDRVFDVLYAIVILFVSISKLEFLTIGDLVIPSGFPVYSIYFVCGICHIIALFVFFRRYNSLKNQDAIVTYLFLFTGTCLCIIVQLFNPEMFLMTPLITYGTFIMYFTIENPDVKMLERVELARDAAEKANRAKSDFLSSMSHEIRTPLNAIVGLSEDIGTYKDEVPEAVKEDAEDIISASQTLLEIVGNILDISKIESNKLEIIETVYQPKEVIEFIAKMDQIRIGEKPIDFKVNIAEDLPYELIGDKVHIKEIINNLLTNAIKYTDKGEINLNVRCINKGDLTNMIISVQDTGRGIKAENINKLFTKFERLDVDKNTTTEGTGLGLAITKRLVEMMHGTINVQSRFGKGSIFVVNIPQKIKTLTTVENNKEAMEDVVIDIDECDGKRILIVDDNTLNIKVAKRALQDFNIEIDEALSGKECLEKVNNGEKYDVILMDIMMPEMSGESTLKNLKQIKEFNTPVIALTADAVAGAEEHYVSEGFADYIAKPFKKEEIKAKLDNLFDNDAPINWDEVPVHIIEDDLPKDNESITN